MAERIIGCLFVFLAGVLIALAAALCARDAAASQTAMAHNAVVHNATLHGTSTAQAQGGGGGAGMMMLIGGAAATGVAGAWLASRRRTGNGSGN